MDGQLQWSRDRWVSADFSGDGRSIDIGNLLSAGATNSPNENSFNYDEVYYDFTRARIEIGDAPTWDECSVRELQIPISWTDTTITLAVNQGVFANGASGFLYVVGTDGSVNSRGYPIVFGESGSPPKPPPVISIE